MTSDDDLDRRILEILQPGYQRKVLYLVLANAHALADTDGGEPPYHRVAERIMALVSAGQLESFGDLTKWDFSEVRLPRR
jgi:hypothetical protein